MKFETDTKQEFVVSKKFTSERRKHRIDIDTEVTTPACNTWTKGSWELKTARQACFYEKCNETECFGGNEHE